MSHDSANGTGLVRRTLLGVVLLAVVVGLVIAAYRTGPSAFPSDMFLGTIVFTVVMLVIGVLAQQTADSTGR